MAVFRVERNKGYTVMSNHHLRNKDLTLKAKGLLSQMLSLPEDWDYTLAGLSHINREKIDAKAEKLYYTALIGYIWYEAPENEKNFTTLLEMINASEAREDDEDFQNPVDLMFERLEQKDPEHFALKQYKKYKLAAGKTAKSILISCGARLAPFDIKELRELMETDEMELDTIGDRKTALFVIISDTDDTFNFVVSILYHAYVRSLFHIPCFANGFAPLSCPLIKCYMPSYMQPRISGDAWCAARPLRQAQTTPNTARIAASALPTGKLPSA